ncbi:hypothetical protein BJ999_006427 [Actinomadura citrea]|uniref:Uncharacterized protein n=1 Tax=Actinomadura citrea TaxID=46158 RepID=A0A7Y9KG56_9ACTN|nr:hypothetical protein [Actinomadura citrea]
MSSFLLAFAARTAGVAAVPAAAVPQGDGRH